ncbi:MAG TPA: serpin family protein [Streptosporangiaceae bacterium]|nr:serpin family protein [Streptosporangiaceae bacterium]
MKNELRAVLALALAGCALAGCGTTPPPRPVMAHGVALREPLVSPRPYGAADAAFGLDVLGAWCRAEPQANLVLSPSSLASGLGMAYLGARGATAQAMDGALHLPAASGQALEAGLQARSAALRGLDGPGVTVNATDQVWADPTLNTLHSYLDAVATGYGAGVARVPLLSKPDQAVQQIDQAIATATQGLIPQLLAPGSLRDIGWMLTDALYLKADWTTPFQASETGPGPFTTAAGRQVSAQFMNGGPYAAASTDGWTAVWLPYGNGRLAMMALLPPAGPGGCALPTAAQLGALATTLAAGGTAGPVLSREISLPKVNLQNQVSMRALLSALGMGVAFTPAADFSALSPQACCIGLVEHAATLQVGEKGTVASAATAVGVSVGAAPAVLPPITFDRPYLMVVTDRTTGEPLFMARVTDPTQP